MAKDNFLLVSLKQDQAKKLAQVISNDTCRQILDFLAEKDATESEIAKSLGIPISTVHYNIHQLVDGGLVVSDEYHYSSKGKEVSHYKLANKYIIISPKSVWGIKEKLKSVLPIAFLGVAIAGIIHFIQKLGMGRTFAAQTMAEVGDGALRAGPEAAKVLAEEAIGAAPIAADAASVGASSVAAGGSGAAQVAADAVVDELAVEAAPIAADAASTAAETGASEAVRYAAQIPEHNIALWFLLGVIFALMLYLVIDFLLSKRK